MTSVQEHIDFLNSLNDWMPWIVKRGEAPTHLVMEFPTLDLEESQKIVNNWLASKQQLLEENVVE